VKTGVIGITSNIPGSGWDQYRVGSFVHSPLAFLAKSRHDYGDVVVLADGGSLFQGASDCRGCIGNSMNPRIEAVPEVTNPLI